MSRVGAVAYALTDIVAGKINDAFKCIIGRIESQKTLAINIHKSADEVKQYTAWGICKRPL